MKWRRHAHNGYGNADDDDDGTKDCKKEIEVSPTATNYYRIKDALVRALAHAIGWCQRICQSHCTMQMACVFECEI